MVEHLTRHSIGHFGDDTLSQSLDWYQQTKYNATTETTSIHKTKSNETQAWFSSPFTPSGQEMDRATLQLPSPVWGSVQ